MKKVDKIYLVSADIAERAQCIDSSYRTKDGHYIISEKALRDFRFQMTAEEYVTGIDAEIISKSQAQILIRENDYAIGPERPEPEVEEEPAAEETPVEENASTEEAETPAADEETTEENNEEEETPAEEETENEETEG